MKAILELSTDREKFASKLVELANQIQPQGGTRIPVFLDRLQDFTENWIPSENIRNIVHAFFHVGDQLLRPESRSDGLFYIHTEERIHRVIRQLLNRITIESDRYMILQYGISRGKAIATIVREIGALGAQHGKYGAESLPESQRLVQTSYLESLENMALEKIRDVAEQGVLLDSPNLAYILYRFKNWSSDDEVKRWAERAIRTNKGLADLLIGFIQSSYIAGSDWTGVHEYIDPKALEPFFDPAVIYNRVSGRLGQPDLTEQEKKSVNLFLTGYRLRQEGKDPSNRFPE